MADRILNVLETDNELRESLVRFMDAKAAHELSLASLANERARRIRDED